MNDLLLYIKESYNELLHKVTWPTWSELLDNSRLVIIGSVIIALVIFLMDVVAKFVTTTIYNL